MDAKLKAKWLRALRSDRYRQTHGYLKSDGGFCCLGVLADVQGCKWNGDGVPALKGEAMSVGASTDFLLPRFAGGLRQSTQRTLSNMNDDDKSLAEIADHIERRIS